MHDEHTCSGSCGNCGGSCEHTPREQLLAMMKFMAGQSAAQVRELAKLAPLLEQEGNRMAYDQVMAAVSDFEKGSLRLNMVLASLNTK